MQRDPFGSKFVVPKSSTAEGGPSRRASSILAPPHGHQAGQQAHAGGAAAGEASGSSRRYAPLHGSGFPDEVFQTFQVERRPPERHSYRRPHQSLASCSGHGPLDDPSDDRACLSYFHAKVSTSHLRYGQASGAGPVSRDELVLPSCRERRMELSRVPKEYMRSLPALPSLAEEAEGDAHGGLVDLRKPTTKSYSTLPLHTGDTSLPPVGLPSCTPSAPKLPPLYGQSGASDFVANGSEVCTRRNPPEVPTIVYTGAEASVAKKTSQDSSVVEKAHSSSDPGKPETGSAETYSPASSPAMFLRHRPLCVGVDQHSAATGSERRRSLSVALKPKERCYQDRELGNRVTRITPKDWLALTARDCSVYCISENGVLCREPKLVETKDSFLASDVYRLKYGKNCHDASWSNYYRLTEDMFFVNGKWQLASSPETPTCTKDRLDSDDEVDPWVGFYSFPSGCGGCQ